MADRFDGLSTDDVTEILYRALLSGEPPLDRAVSVTAFVDDVIDRHFSSCRPTVVARPPIKVPGQKSKTAKEWNAWRERVEKQEREKRRAQVRRSREKLRRDDAERSIPTLQAELVGVRFEEGDLRAVAVEPYDPEGPSSEIVEDMAERFAAELGYSKKVDPREKARRRALLQSSIDREADEDYRSRGPRYYAMRWWR